VKIRYTSFCCFLRPMPASSLQVCLKRQFFYINNTMDQLTFVYIAAVERVNNQ